ncbi:hypothetical protein BSG1_00015, partial [Bacillus sp. SG-1]
TDGDKSGDILQIMTGMVGETKLSYDLQSSYSQVFPTNHN